jgi:hypothetical protein
MVSDRIFVLRFSGSIDGSVVKPLRSWTKTINLQLDGLGSSRWSTGFPCPMTNVQRVHFRIVYMLSFQMPATRDLISSRISVLEIVAWRKARQS